MTSFSQILDQDLEQGKLMAEVNSRNKGPKTKKNILSYKGNLILLFFARSKFN